MWQGGRLRLHGSNAVCNWQRGHHKPFHRGKYSWPLSSFLVRKGLSLSTSARVLVHCRLKYGWSCWLRSSCHFGKPPPTSAPLWQSKRASSVHVTCWRDVAPTHHHAARFCLARQLCASPRCNGGETESVGGALFLGWGCCNALGGSRIRLNLRSSDEQPPCGRWAGLSDDMGCCVCVGVG